jgi:2-polyprenyl-6-hydroxyphenyl methylase/3-demethylubiquinone-9 3-methyltransferase
MSERHTREIATGQRFPFGENWSRFLEELDEDRIRRAQASLQQMLRVDDLQGLKFLDIGSGSGLFSLAARRLGAKVHSFDYDPQSIACAAELKRRYALEDADWTIEEGSVLDREYLARLGEFDVVYSWGVLHHTGALREALANVAPLVAPAGKLWIAIYNDQGWTSRYWLWVKKQYNRGAMRRGLLTALHAPYLFGLRWCVRTWTGRRSLERGMSLWRDTIDWLGGYPFEVARPEEVFHFFRDRGLVLEELKTCGGRMGCNEFVFRRPAG